MSINQLASKPDKVGAAIFMIIAADCVVSVADAVIKVTVSDMPLSQLIFLRSCLTSLSLIVILRLYFPRLSLLPVHAGWAVLRSVLILASLLLYYASLPHLDFSMAAAVYYTIPLFITLFATVWMREPVGLKGWVGVAIGFFGVILMLKPQTGSLSLYALMPLVSANFFAVAMILTRTRSRAENPFVLALASNVTAVVVGGLASAATWLAGENAPAWMGDSVFLGPWIDMGWALWGVIVLLSVAMLVGSVGTAVAYQLGPPSVISIFDFSYLAFAVLWGIVLFGERIDAVSMMGIALIAVAGIIVTRRRVAR